MICLRAEIKYVEIGICLEKRWVGKRKGRRKVREVEKEGGKMGGSSSFQRKFR